MAGAGATAGARPTRTSRRLASANGEDGSPLKSLPTTTTRRTTKGRRATVEQAPIQDASADNDNVLQSREETESRSTSPAPQQQKPLRRSARTVSRSVSPSQKPLLTTTKPRQSAAPRKIAEPKTAKTRRGKKAAAAVDLPSIIESPVKSPPGAFPADSVHSPPRASDNYITSLALTPSHLSTATKRAADSSADRSVESPSNLSLFNSSKRSRTDDWSPGQQLLGDAGLYSEHLSSSDGIRYGGTTDGPSSRDASPIDTGSSINNLSSTNNQSSAAVASAGSIHSSPASDQAPAPVSHGLFARFKSFIPSLSARASRFQVQNAPVEFPSPTPIVSKKNFTSPNTRDLATTTAAPEKASESPLPSITPITVPATAPVSRRWGSLNDSTPEFLKSTKRTGFFNTPKHTIQNNNDDDAGYDSDEYREIIDKAASARPSPSAHANSRAALRKMTEDLKAKSAAGGTKGIRQDGLIKAMLQPRQPRSPLKVSQGRNQASRKSKSGSGSMHISAVKSHSGDANSAASFSASAISVSHSAVVDFSPTTSSSVVYDASSTSASSLHASANQFAVNVVPSGFVLVPVNVLYVPATASNVAFTITDFNITETLGALATLANSVPQANFPTPVEAVSLFEQHINNSKSNDNHKPDTSLPEQSAATPRSAMKGSRSFTDGDIHAAQRHSKRVAWQQEERDSPSLDPPATQNSNGKRDRGTYSADDLVYSDDEDEVPVKRVIPRGDYSADIYDSDTSDDSLDEVSDELSDVQLSQFLTGIVEYDVAFVKFYEQRQPQAATRLWRLLKARLREEDEERKKKEKKQPAFDLMSPISERSESSVVEADGLTPSLPSGGEVESSSASVAPRQRSPLAAPVTPLRKSYTPSVSSQLRNVTNASSPVSPTPPRPLASVLSLEDIFAAVDRAPSPPLCRIPGIFFDTPSAADNMFGPI